MSCIQNVHRLERGVLIASRKHTTFSHLDAAAVVDVCVGAFLFFGLDVIGYDAEVRIWFEGAKMHVIHMDQFLVLDIILSLLYLLHV